MGIVLLTEEEYLALQTLGEFDTKRSSWIATPADFREQGGALLGGRELRPRLHRLQRRAVVLRRAGISGCGAGMNADTNSHVN